MRRALKKLFKDRRRLGNGDEAVEDMAGPVPPAPTGPDNSPATVKHSPEADKTNQDPLAAFADLWAQAYQNVKANKEHAGLLEKFEKYIADGRVDSLHDDTAPDTGDSTDEEECLRCIQGIANRKLEEICSSDTAHRLSFSIRGKPFIVRDVIRTVVTAISAAKGLIGAAVSAEPHASLAWAGIMTILPFLENVFQQDADAADGFTNLVFLLLRCQVIQKETLPMAFWSASQSKARHDLLLDTKDKMVHVYEEAYVYQLRFVRQYAGGRVHRILRNAFAVDDWKKMWMNIESTGRQIDKGLEDCARVKILTIGTAVGKLEIKAGLIHDAVLDGNQRALLRELPYADNAPFDSAAVKYTEQPCLQGTRLDVLNDIQNWADNPEAEPVYWLQGMAGTGKTSVSLTVADALNEHRPFAGGKYDATASPAIFLGGSFFFKQGDAKRNTTGEFYTTIARQLAHNFPDLMVHIAQYIGSVSAAVKSKPRKDQFENLILKPVSMVDQTTFLSMRLIITIDALDECEDLPGVKGLIGMLKDLQTLCQVQLRFFVTSRAEHHIVEGFEALPRELYRK